MQATPGRAAIQPIPRFKEAQGPEPSRPRRREPSQSTQSTGDRGPQVMPDDPSAAGEPATRGPEPEDDARAYPAEREHAGGRADVDRSSGVDDSEADDSDVDDSEAEAETETETETETDEDGSSGQDAPGDAGTGRASEAATRDAQPNPDPVL